VSSNIDVHYATSRDTFACICTSERKNKKKDVNLKSNVDSTGKVMLTALEKIKENQYEPYSQQKLNAIVYILSKKMSKFVLLCNQIHSTPTKSVGNLKNLDI
jgi:hypothetical protein